MSSMIERARALRRVIEQLAETLDDDAAAESAELFPQWDPDGHDYAAGDRVRDEDVLYKVLQAHTSQPEWPPADAPSLFARILAGQDGTEIGDRCLGAARQHKPLHDRGPRALPDT